MLDLTVRVLNNDEEINLENLGQFGVSENIIEYLEEISNEEVEDYPDIEIVKVTTDEYIDPCFMETLNKEVTKGNMSIEESLDYLIEVGTILEDICSQDENLLPYISDILSEGYDLSAISDMRYTRQYMEDIAEEMLNDLWGHALDELGSLNNYITIDYRQFGQDLLTDGGYIEVSTGVIYTDQ